jgi:uncharacterized membrane protein
MILEKSFTMVQDTLTAAPAPHAPTVIAPPRAPLVSRLFDSLLLITTIATAGSVLWGYDTDAEMLFYIISSFLWAGLGVLYTVIRARRISKARKGDPRWTGWLASARTARLMTVGTTIIVLCSGINLAYAKGKEDDISQVVEGISLGLVLVAWMVLQLAYAERYARLYLTSTDETPPLDFPGTEKPTLLEFAYFSFTVGVTFGTSDVSIQSTRWRGIVLCHGLLVFVYNTAIIGMVLGFLS